MIKKDLVTYVILLIAAAAGYFIKGYVGGMITGAAALLLILAVIGKTQAMKAATRLDRNVKDILINEKQ